MIVDKICWIIEKSIYRFILASSSLLKFVFLLAVLIYKICISEMSTKKKKKIAGNARKILLVKHRPTANRNYKRVASEKERKYRR